MNITKGIKYAVASLCMVVLTLVMAGQVTGQGAIAGQIGTTALSGSNAEQTDVSEQLIKVYYLHTTVRCYSCNKIERLTREAVNEAFGKEIARGLIKVEVLNVDDPENKHFIQDYQLFTKSVIVSHVSGSKEQRWKNLQKVWELLGDERAFKAYVQKEVQAYLPEKRA